MKKTTSILVGTIVLILLIVFIMFRNKEQSAVENVKVPDNNLLIAAGVWQIDKKENFADSKSKISDEIGKLYVDQSIVVFGKRFTINPKFSSKFVSLQNYINKKTNDESLSKDFSKDKKMVITISDGSKFYQDVVVMDKNNIILPYNGVLYYMKKTENKVSRTFIENYQSTYESKYYENKGNNLKDKENIAMLIGIKNKVIRDGKSDISYRTILLDIDKKNSAQIYQTSSLFFPRKNGFWIMDYKRNEFDNNYVEQFITKPVYSGENTKDNRKLEFDSPSEITYLGPEYISIMKIKDQFENYSIFDIDKMSNNNELNIDQIGGKEAVNVLKNSIAEESADPNIEVSTEDKNENYKNIGIIRNSGKWSYQTQYTLKDNNEIKLKNVSLNIVSQLNISPDELSMNWQSIKNLKSSALDAYSSPDKRILVVQTTDEILIYDYSNDNKLIGSIPITKNDSIIMSEWATGNYAEMWKKEFKNNEKIPSTFIINQRQ
ncbi:hypothetical protein B9N57_03120 [Finegoldia magna]|uniref:hypothetical protein n=1 Tax=Finegoldia magna TaxID=1260 RepID=UPI000B91C197|nr:hypothetical protein [Finegoldia magna]OXZ30878.1 hypothetical protein B9N57_03120 [Finegoldia magna]